MMVTIGVYLRRGQRFLRRWAADPRVHTLLQGGGFLLAGFCASAASLGNQFQPLALGLLCSQSGWPAVLTAMGALGGYFVFWGNTGAQGAVWIAAGLLAALMLSGRKLQRETPLLMPAVAGFLVACTGLAFQYLGLDSPPVQVYLLRIGVAALCAYLFCSAAERRDPIVDWLVSGLGVLALAQLMPIP